MAATVVNMWVGILNIVAQRESHAPPVDDEARDRARLATLFGSDQVPASILQEVRDTCGDHTAPDPRRTRACACELLGRRRLERVEARERWKTTGLGALPLGGIAWLLHRRRSRPGSPLPDHQGSKQS